MDSRNPFDRVMVAFAWVSLTIWGLSWILDAIAQSTGREYDIPGSVPTIAMGVAVFLFGARKFFRKDGE